MQPCQEYEALISAAADGEATEAECRALMEHLSRCESCREAYTQSMLLHDAFSGWEEKAPESLRTSVMEQVRKEPRQKKRPRRSWMPLMAAAACLALIVVGFQVNNTLRPNTAQFSQNDIRPADDVEETMMPDGAEDERSAEQAKDPAPQVENDVTQYGTGAPTPDSEENPQPRVEIPSAAAFGGNLPVMTVTCDDPALPDWMEANVDQEGTATEEGTLWVLSAQQWQLLEAYLQEGGFVYETAGTKTPDQLSEGDLVEILCLNGTAE